MELGLSSQSTPFCKHGGFSPPFVPDSQHSQRAASARSFNPVIAASFACSGLSMQQAYPELITHQHRPARRIKEAFETGGCRKELFEHDRRTPNSKGRVIDLDQ
jgi:hypothetical protein